MGARTRTPRTKKGKTASTELTTNGDEKAELLPPAVDDEVIEEVALGLNDLQRAHGLNLAVEMGKLIVDKFFDGDLDAWRERNVKDASVRKLAKHPKLAVSASTVSRAVRIYEVSERLGSDWKNLGASHLRAVLGLEEADQQRLLTTAEDKGWTVDRVDAEAQKVRKKIADGRGRPPLPRFQKSLQQMGKFFADPDDSFGDTEKIDELEDQVALSLFKTVTDAKAKIDELQKQLQKRVRGLDA